MVLSLGFMNNSFVKLFFNWGNAFRISYELHHIGPSDKQSFILRLCYGNSFGSVSIVGGIPNTSQHRLSQLMVVVEFIAWIDWDRTQSNSIFLCSAHTLRQIRLK